jgi:hypothetical protein
MNGSQIRVVATYPLGPTQQTGTPLWVQDSVFMPWQAPAPNNPFYGMAMYGGFVQANYPQWVPSYQPGMSATTGDTGFSPGMYSGFVNEHKMEGI